MKQEKKKNLKLMIIIAIAVVVIIIAIVGMVNSTNKNSKTVETKADVKEKKSTNTISEAEAIEVNWDTVVKDIQNNIAKVELEYSGKVVKYTGEVVEISSNYCELHQGLIPYYYAGSARLSHYQQKNKIRVYLSKEELAKLEKEKKITVIGKVSTIREPPIAHNDYNLTLTPAYVESFDK